MSDSKKLQELVIGGAKYSTRLTNKFINRSRWERPDEHRIKAVIPGTIQEIMVQEGQEVETDTPLLILEAMKMRNQIRAEISGTIKKIHVKKGEMVAKNQLLLEFSSEE